VTPAAHRDAAASGLHYVSPDGPGITRRRAGRGFTYTTPSGRRIRAAAELARIRAIAVPPAWTEVWICPDPDGHLQAVGRDSRGRRQYRYHARFRARRDDGKFARLIRFGARLPRIRRRVRQDLARPGLPRDKVLAAVVSLLETTRLRVGNEQYARLNRSFGVSTLRDRHATVSGTTVRFRFRGKGGRTEERSLVDRRLATIVRRCQELPGQDLFQYVDEDGEARGISSEDVNAYLREAAGSDDLSAKDVRTWTATMLAYRELRDGARGAHGDEADPRRAAGSDRHRGGRRNAIAEALRRTAEELGDTVTVTRASYVHPGVLAAFEPGGAGEPDRATDPSERGPGRRGGSRNGSLDRRDELAVLALLRGAGRAAASGRGTGAARRSQVGRAGVAARARGRSA
jgi:DNA topoisomerase-1